MGTGGLRVYRVHGIYYCIAVYWDAYPSGTGNDILQEIPRDPEELKAWIAQKIESFEQEEKTLDERESYPLYDGYYLSGGGVSQPDKENCPWGEYERKPCRSEPSGNVHIRWIYIIDLDNSCFVVRNSSGWSREFKLENPPRHLFEQSLFEELLILPISLSYLHTPAHAIGPNIADINRFVSFAPRQYTVEVLEQSHFKAPAVLDPWKPLSQLLLQKFLERYIKLLKELATTKSLSILASTGLGGGTMVEYKFKQLAYGILNLCDPAGRIRFRPKRHAHYTGRTSSDPPRSPQWESPCMNVMWLGEVLIILEARIAVEEFLHAAIGKAIDLIRRSRVRAGGIQGTAVIFSIQALVIVNIRYPDDNTDEPEITFSQTFPVITPSECSWYRCFGGLRARPTKGLAALIDVFARQREAYTLPACLPVKICTQIYKLCNLATRKSMAGSCRAFKAIVDTYPCIDGWDLLHSWNHGNVNFVAIRGEGLAKSVVSLEDANYPHSGCEMALFRGDHQIDLDLPWLGVVKQQQEGYKECACCVGLPVLSEAPQMLSRIINIPTHIEEEREMSIAAK